MVWREDSMGQSNAAVWPLKATEAPRVWEINGPDAWTELVDRYPMDVMSARRHDWYRTTGRVGTWKIFIAEVPDDQPTGIQLVLKVADAVTLRMGRSCRGPSAGVSGRLRAGCVADGRRCWDRQAGTSGVQNDHNLWTTAAIVVILPRCRILDRNGFGQLARLTGPGDDGAHA
jgi:hypothetical protein